jgi:hypothetical protein
MLRYNYDSSMNGMRGVSTPSSRYIVKGAVEEGKWLALDQFGAWHLLFDNIR